MRMFLPLSFSSFFLAHSLYVYLFSCSHTLSDCLSFRLYLLPSLTTSSQGINILIALMSFQDPQPFPWFKSGGSPKSFSSGTVDSLPPSTCYPDLSLYKVRKWWVSLQLSSSHILFCPYTTALSMKDLGWEPRVGGRQGSVLFGDTLGKITDWWQWHPCLLVFSLFHLKNIYLTQVLTRPCAGG